MNEDVSLGQVEFHGGLRADFGERMVVGENRRPLMMNSACERLTESMLCKASSLFSERRNSEGIA